MSQLKACVIADDPEGIARLVAKGARIDDLEDGNEGWTAAFVAAVCDAPAALDCLIELGAPIEFEKQPFFVRVGEAPSDREWLGRTTLLHIAAALLSPRAVTALLARGVHVDVPDPTGATPLHYAAFGATLFARA